MDEIVTIRKNVFKKLKRQNCCFANLKQLYNIDENTEIHIYDITNFYAIDIMHQFYKTFYFQKMELWKYRKMIHVD